MKNKILLAIVFFLFAQLSLMEAKSDLMYQSEAGIDMVVNEAEEEIPVYIPDGRFLKRLIAEGVDSNGDGVISYAEAKAVTDLDLSIEDYCYPNADMITFLKGIEAFVNLETLNLDGNMLSNLNITNAPNLRVLRCKMNMITKIDFRNNYMLEELDCSWNHLSELDLTENRYLRKLNCAHNQFSTIDLSQNYELTHLNANSYTTKEQATCASLRSNPGECTPLDFLDLSNNRSLEYLMVCGRNFDELDISNNTALKVIFLLGMKENSKVYVWWCDPNPPEDVKVIEVFCDFPMNYTCHGEKGSDNELVGLDRRLADQMKIFPNPAVNFITIQTPGNESSLVNITSLSGKILHSEKFSGGSHNMDISKYQRGMYLITVRSGEMTVTKKIILR